MKDRLQSIKVNFSGVTRHDTMAGKDYLVAPAVMIVEGVLDGSHGPLLYPAEELKKSVPLWNNKPVVLYHPQANGQGISACDPDVITNRGLGVMMHTRFADNKLKTEVWLDMERVEKIDERILEAVENEEMMELSTGLLTDDEDTEGEWDGVHYDAVARNYRPDHLAILPDQTGACSIEDGAGFLRLNKAGDKLTFLLKESTLKERMWMKENTDHVFQALCRIITNDMSDDDKRGLLYGLLNKGGENEIGVWIMDVFSDDEYFVYEKNGSLFSQDFEEKKGVLSLTGLPMEVKKDVNYVAISNRKDNMMSKMSKKKIIDGLISNDKTLWSEDNREWLLTQDKEVLENMVPVENDDDDDDDNKASESQAAESKADEGKAAEGKADEGKANTDETTENMTVDEYIAKMNAPDAIQDMLRNGMASHKADKKRLINTITANDQNVYTEEQLGIKPLDELQRIAVLAVNSKNPAPERQVNYGGQGDTVPIGNEKEEPLALPTMNFTKPN